MIRKALELIGALDHDKTFCFFLASRNQNTNVGKMVLFFKVKTYIYIYIYITNSVSIPSIVVTNRQSAVIAAEPSVIALVENISTCNYTTRKA